MPTTPLRCFELAARNDAGEVRVCSIHAADAADAFQQAAREGLRVLSCEERTGGLPLNFRRSSPQNSRIDVAQFAQELALLLDAGLGIVQAIETLAEKEQAKGSGTVLERVTAALNEGLPLSKVMGEMPGVFPALLVASIASSEQTGDMAVTLRRYAANAETLRNIRPKVLNASVYPLMLMGVGTAVVLFLLGIVVPRFARLIEASHVDIPFASRVLMDVGATINAYPEFAIGSVATAALLFAWGFHRAAASGWNLSFIQRLPIIGPLARTFRHVNFYRTSAMLIAGGIPAVRAFEMCGSLLTPTDGRNLQTAIQSIRAGSPLAKALQRAGLADAVSLRMLTVAQQTGQLADILARIASFKESTLSRAIEVATRLFEPILMLLIGLVIGGIVVLMYLPIFDLASSLQ